jgi:polyhydroxyalkanoate synthesis regulator phasin
MGDEDEVPTSPFEDVQEDIDELTKRIEELDKKNKGK